MGVGGQGRAQVRAWVGAQCPQTVVLEEAVGFVVLGTAEKRR